MIRLILLLFLFTIVSCKQLQIKPLATFRVGVYALPAKIDPRNNQVNIFHYIDLQLFYPLFEKADDLSLNSAFLDLKATRALSSEFRSFRFCLKDSIAFSDGTLITNTHLKRSIESAHLALHNLIPIEKIILASDRCTEVTLKQRDIRYLDKLTTIQSTILKEENAVAPIGLGPYRIESFHKNRLVLLLNQAAKQDQVNQVEFIKVYSLEDAQKAQIDDWNHIQIFETPEDIKTNSIPIKRVLLKSYFLLLDIKNKANRQNLWRCLDRTKLANTLRLSVEVSSSYLPKSLPGATLANYSPTWDGPCVKQKRAVKRLPIVCTGERYCDGFKMYLNEFSSQLPLAFDIIELPPADMIQRVLKNDVELISLIANDTSEYDPSGFFTQLYGNNRVNNLELTDIKNFISSAALAESPSQIDRLFQKAHQAVIESGFIYPIGQVVATHYYPKRISNIKVLDNSLDFPNISQLRVDH
jgi:hypothetical protein